jgi:hypothetical protein
VSQRRDQAFTRRDRIFATAPHTVWNVYETVLSLDSRFNPNTEDPMGRRTELIARPIPLMARCRPTASRLHPFRTNTGSSCVRPDQTPINVIGNRATVECRQVWEYHLDLEDRHLSCLQMRGEVLTVLTPSGKPGKHFRREARLFLRTWIRYRAMPGAKSGRSFFSFKWLGILYSEQSAAEPGGMV